MQGFKHKFFYHCFSITQFESPISCPSVWVIIFLPIKDHLDPNNFMVMVAKQGFDWQIKPALVGFK